MNTFRTVYDVLDDHAADLDEVVLDDAREIIERWGKEGHGHNPRGTAAAAVYAARRRAHVDTTQAEVAERFDVCEVTVRNRLHEFGTY